MKKENKIHYRDRNRTVPSGGRTGGRNILGILVVFAFMFVPVAFMGTAQAVPTAYVSVYSEGSVVTAIGADNVYDMQRSEIDVGNNPRYLAANPSGTRVYVPNYYSDTVSVIDTSTNDVTTVDDSYSGFYSPYAVAVSPDGTEAWVVNSDDEDGDVSIVDTATNAVVAKIYNPCGYNPTGIVFNPNPSRPEAYLVGNPEGPAVCVVDTDPASPDYRTVINTVGLDSEVGNGEYAVVTPDGTYVYVTGDEITRIDTTDSYSTILISPYDLNSVTYLAVSNDGTKVYAAGGDYWLEFFYTSADTIEADDYIEFYDGNNINAVTVVPGTDLGFVTDDGGGYLSKAYPFDTSGDQEITDSEGVPMPVDLYGTPNAIIAVNPRSAQAAELTFRDDGLGNGWCGVVFDAGGKGGPGPWGGAALFTLYFAMFLLPVWILKRMHGWKPSLSRPALLSLVLILGLCLAAALPVSAADLVPKAQRFHPTSDGFGTPTLDSDKPLGQGIRAFVYTLNMSKRPFNKGDVKDLSVRAERVHDLATMDLAGAYGLTPDFQVGVDIPFNFLYDGKDTLGVDGSNSNIGDIRVNGKWSFLARPKYGLALVPFVTFPSGNDDYYLSEGKAGYGAKLAGHLATTEKLTLIANLGAELIGHTPSREYKPWIQYGVGASYDLTKTSSLVAEINGETTGDKPFDHTVVSPLEFLAAYRNEWTPGWTYQVGGGGGLNKGMGAPQWRGFMGVAYLK